MTANVFREDVEKCLDAGMDGHIGKPLDIEQVLDKLRLYLLKNENKSSSHDESAANHRLDRKAFV